MTRTKRMTAQALHTSTTDRPGPASAQQLQVHSRTRMLSRLLPILVLPFVLPVSTKGAPVVFQVLVMSLWSQNWPRITTPAGPRPQPSLCDHPSTPLFMLIPREATLPGLGIRLEMGSRKGRVGPEGTMVMGLDDGGGGQDGSRHTRRCL